MGIETTFKNTQTAIVIICFLYLINMHKCFWDNPNIILLRMSFFIDKTVNKWNSHFYSPSRQTCSSGYTQCQKKKNNYTDKTLFYLLILIILPQLNLFHILL